MDRLNADGWNIESIPFASGDLAAQAVAEGTAQFGEGSVQYPLIAAQQGFPTKWIANQNPQEFVIISKTEIQDCEGLDGARFAIHSAGSPFTAMSNEWLASCNASPTVLEIPGGEVRIVALADDQIDATYVQILDWIALDNQHPGEFHVLVGFNEVAPDLGGAGFYANDEWLASNRDVAVAFLAEVLMTFRMVKDDPGPLHAKGEEVLPPQHVEVIEETIAAYRDLGWFPVNGGLEPGEVEGTIAFYEQMEIIEPGLTAEEAVDRTILDDALDIIGRVQD
jgi:ABC-type nitrate/sulfonate/bicarbonate transport system substrate-binding protein